MSQKAIEVHELRKRYRIGRADRHDTLRDLLSDAARNSLQRLSGRGAARPGDDQPDVIWALDGLSFDVEPGEVMGVIGRNGAGKSTLLKVLCRITRPTTGRALVRGRVGSLLEVGTGFHPELTGRENVFLSGAILGMKRAEITRKFDEIVAFSEVEKFIDTPIKRYSTGMYVRLAFSVAAHLEPEILFVDEVLAVGDARFGSKCMDKMRALHAQGMTIFLVTHSMWQIQTICTRVICLNQGRIVADGGPTGVIAAYRNFNQTALGPGAPRSVAAGSSARLLSLEIEPESANGTGADRIYPDSGLHVVMTAAPGPMADLRFFVRVTSPDGLPYFTVFSEAMQVGGRSVVGCRTTIPRLMLRPDNYVLWAGICLSDNGFNIPAESSIPFAVEGECDAEEFAPNAGLFLNQASWQVQ